MELIAKHADVSTLEYANVISMFIIQHISMLIMSSVNII